MKHSFVALLVGLLFGLGLTVSGMTQPLKVISFLDFFGEWDPSLAFVMVGAIAVHFIAYRFQKHQTSPLLGGDFSLPSKKNIDWKLLAGALIFGVGWGLGGYCPGPALASLVSLQLEVVVFVAAMTAGMFLQTRLEKIKTTKSQLGD